MNLLIDGILIDTTGIFANKGVTHQAFVSKQWVLSGLDEGVHTLSLNATNSNTLSDSNDIYFVTVMEMPY